MTASTGPATANPHRSGTEPLYALTVGTVVGTAVAVSTTGWSEIAWAGPVMLVIAVTAGVVAVPRRHRPVLWCAIGLLLGLGRGSFESVHAAQLRSIASDHGAVRAELTIVEDWHPTRWGARTNARWHSATRRGLALEAPRRCRLEVRSAPLNELPLPGTRVRTLASLRTDDGRRALLVVAAPTLLETVSSASGIHAVRAHAANSLLDAAGVNLHRIRAAELAASLTLGRRDLLPWGRQEQWRRSGLSHVLAVSGLHIGLLAGLIWLGGVALRGHPNVIRATLAVLVPAYAAVAGAGTSAQRAALMMVVFLAARMLGRHIAAYTAVLLAVWVLLLVEPAMVLEPGFQLTAAITAVLVRWAPEVTRALPLPVFISGVLTVPILAQLTSTPIVLAHFRQISLAAFTTNTLIPFLLAPILIAAMVATITAGWLTPLAAVALSLLDCGERVILAAGAFARSSVLITPSLAPVLAWSATLIGLMALAPSRRARPAAAAFALLVCATGVWGGLPAPADTVAVTLVPVTDGACVMATTPHGRTVVDAGHWRSEASRLLADRRIRRIDTLVLTHADEDHIGGADQLLRSTHPANLVFPACLRRDPGLVPIRRLARRLGVRERLVARGQTLTIAGTRLDTLWPTLRPPPLDDNDRSLVARLQIGSGSVLITGDLTSGAEQLAVERLPVASDVLVVPHHGSNGSCSRWLLDRVQPRLALIPAGAENLHNHPHPAVIQRLGSIGAQSRWPGRDGWCGVRASADGWQLFPARSADSTPCDSTSVR